jgi:hypothetical protein
MDVISSALAWHPERRHQSSRKNALKSAVCSLAPRGACGVKVPDEGEKPRICEGLAATLAAAG